MNVGHVRRISWRYVGHCLLYMVLVFLIWRNRKAIWADRASRTIVLILGAYLLVFGLAIGNFGTGIQHRAKFFAALIALAAPLLPKLVLFRNTKSVTGGALKWQLSSF